MWHVGAYNTVVTGFNNQARNAAAFCPAAWILPFVLGNAVTDWETMRDTAVWYVDQKCSVGRFDAYYDPTQAPTWDMMKNREIAP